MTTRKTSSYIRIAGGIICLLFSLAACDNQTIYHTYQNLSIEGWKKTDTLKSILIKIYGWKYYIRLVQTDIPIPSISHWQTNKATGKEMELPAIYTSIPPLTTLSLFLHPTVWFR